LIIINNETPQNVSAGIRIRETFPPRNILLEGTWINSKPVWFEVEQQHKMAGGSKDMKNAVAETIPGKKVSCVAILNI